MYYDTVCRFSCNEGYIGSGSQVRRCQYNGIWSGQEYICQPVTCPLPTNAVLQGCKSGETEIINGTECRFSCKEESKVAGSTVRRCIKDGKWSGAESSCTGIRTTNIRHENEKESDVIPEVWFLNR